MNISQSWWWCLLKEIYDVKSWSYVIMKVNWKTHIEYDEQMNERLSCVTCSECDTVEVET